eukprot:m.137625 g.137625  ORF g.137625 m.137625 type:complete len:925 (-) comp14756_c0_seq4:186-2960(-)
MFSLLVASSLLLVSAGTVTRVSLGSVAGNETREFFGVGGLSGGATSNFLFSYEDDIQNEILDLLFKPGYAASLNILKVEIGCDDQTTDGCEACHMRTPTEVNCNRGYEWDLMKAAVSRNPSVTLVGLPWGFAGWLGYGQDHNPYVNVTATADYIARWVECGRDTHGLNISVIGLWNEMSFTTSYILALRKRFDESNLGHVRIICPDGDIASAAQVLSNNETVKDAVWALGAHYPNGGGTNNLERSLDMVMWSSEDYSTYSDATGAGCWGRLLVQNLGWGYTATISWYLLGSFARGMDYDSDGLLRAEWPTSGHYELTPMLYITMHWTLFTQPGWRVMSCSDGYTGRCAMKGGGNYAVLYSSKNDDITIVAHAFTHSTSKCIRKDPPPWNITATQKVEFDVSEISAKLPTKLHVWRSCSDWIYPAPVGSSEKENSYLQQQNDVLIENGVATLIIERDCYYTLTTITRTPTLNATKTKANMFPLPYNDSFENGKEDGGEALYFGDQMGKFEIAKASERNGNSLRQQVVQWPVSCPWCDHSQPITIIGDEYWEDLNVSIDVYLESDKESAAVALRVQEPSNFFRDNCGGLFLWVDGTKNQWRLCQDSYCNHTITQGSSAVVKGQTWIRLQLVVDGMRAIGSINGNTVVNMTLNQGDRQSCLNSVVQHGGSIVGGDYTNLPLDAAANTSTNTEACLRACCQDIGKCKAWALEDEAQSPGPHCIVGKPCCWLKSVGSVIARKSSQSAMGVIPSIGYPIPSVGWAALATSLGNVQFDNLNIQGLYDDGKSAVPHCTAGAQAAQVSSVPCTYPGAMTAWSLGPNSEVQLSSTVCMHAGSDGLVSTGSCGSNNTIIYNRTTGMLTTGSGVVTSNQNTSVMLSQALPIPSDGQQFQFSSLGQFRNKASSCLKSSPTTPVQPIVNYRDCCLALC